MRPLRLMSYLLVLAVAAGCAAASFRQVSFAGEASRAVDSAGRTVHVVRNNEMKDTVLEARIRGHLEQFLLDRGFSLAPAATAETYVMAIFGTGPRVVGTTAAVFRPAEVQVQRSPSGSVTGRTYTPDHMEYRRVPGLENSLWLMVLSSDAQHFRQKGEVRNLWRGEAAMRGSPEKLAEAMPYLLVPALRWFGKGTAETLLVDVRESQASPYR